MKKPAYIAVNNMRSSTSHGFGNTWDVYRCKDQAERNKILRRGLAVKDQALLMRDGKTRPVLSTMGIRAARPEEIRWAKRVAEQYNEDVTMIDAGGCY